MRDFVQLEEDAEPALRRNHASAVCLVILSIGTTIAAFGSDLLQPYVTRESLTLAAARQLGLNGQPLKYCEPESTVIGPNQSTDSLLKQTCSKPDSDDLGFQEVCVVLSEQFMKKSARNDGHDLFEQSIAPGTHFCIGAWAWASAVQRDPMNAEGLYLICDATSMQLREIYKKQARLDGPTGNQYKTITALSKIIELCGPDPIESKATKSLQQPCEDAKFCKLCRVWLNSNLQYLRHQEGRKHLNTKEALLPHCTPHMNIEDAAEEARSRVRQVEHAGVAASLNVPKYISRAKKRDRGKMSRLEAGETFGAFDEFGSADPSEEAWPSETLDGSDSRIAGFRQKQRR